MGVIYFATYNAIDSCECHDTHIIPGPAMPNVAYQWLAHWSDLPMVNILPVNIGYWGAGRMGSEKVVSSLPVGNMLNFVFVLAK